MVADDFNNDGNLDIAICGNDYGNEVSAGRYDAMNGLVLTGDGKGNFNATSALQSGLFVNEDAKAMIRLTGLNGSLYLAASQNRGPLKLYKMRNNGTMIKVNADDAYALVQLQNGKTRKQEFYYGTSCLSQSSRFLNVNGTVRSVRIFNNRGASRVINY
jgi:hypothetical protein